MKKLDLVLIEWADAESQDAWTEMDDVRNVPKKVYSVGWLLLEDDDAVTLIGSKSSDDMCFASVTIPKGMILKRTKLKE